MVTDLGIFPYYPPPARYSVPHSADFRTICCMNENGFTGFHARVQKHRGKKQTQGKARWVARAWPQHGGEESSPSFPPLLAHLRRSAGEAQTRLPPLLLPLSLSRSPRGASYCPSWTEAKRSKEQEEGKVVFPPRLMATSRHSIHRKLPTNSFLLARDTKQLSQDPGE